MVDPERAQGFPARSRAEWEIDLDAGTVRLLDPPPSLADLTLPLEPMIGCFGVAPAGGEAIATSTPGAHGGNMDWRGFKPGATVWFPVHAPGALFSAGDGHARQGDGEIGGTGVEVSMEMEFRFDLRKDWPIRWPRGITADGAEIFTVGSARPLDQALQHATTEMLDWLETDYGFDTVAASHLMAPGRRLRRRQRLQPGLHGRLPHGQGVSRVGESGAGVESESGGRRSRRGRCLHRPRSRPDKCVMSRGRLRSALFLSP